MPIARLPADQSRRQGELTLVKARAARMVDTGVFPVENAMQAGAAGTTAE
jgi:hypothetical protein